MYHNRSRPTPSTVIETKRLWEVDRLGGGLTCVTEGLPLSHSLGVHKLAKNQQFRHIQGRQHALAQRVNFEQLAERRLEQDLHVVVREDEGRDCWDSAVSETPPPSCHEEETI